MKMKSNKAFHPYGAQGAPRVNADVGHKIMRNIFITLVTLTMAPLAMAQNEPPAPTIFSFTTLTAEQVASAKEFREKQGDARTQEWSTLQPLFPRYHTIEAAPSQVRVVEHPSVMMTTADLVSLLG